MIPSIDYLTLVVAGSILLAGASNLLEDDHNAAGFGLFLLGLFLFIIGTIRALIGALGV